MTIMTFAQRIVDAAVARWRERMAFEERQAARYREWQAAQVEWERQCEAYPELRETDLEWLEERDRRLVELGLKVKGK